MSNNILVLGGTGKTGKRVADRLIQSGVPVRIGSRNAHPGFDWNAPQTWDPVLEGIRKVYVTYQPDLAVPGAVATIRAFTEKAISKGVQQLVLLSGRGEQEAQQCEQIVMNSGIGYTIVRASWFNQNFSENFLVESINAGVVALPVGAVQEPFIDIEDIADIVTAALTGNAHRNQLYEVTGPELLTFKEAVERIATAINRPVQYLEVSMDDYVAQLQEYGLPEDFIWLVRYLFTEVLDGRNASLSNGVEQALGKKPRDFNSYIQRTLLTGAWNRDPQ